VKRRAKLMVLLLHVIELCLVPRRYKRVLCYRHYTSRVSCLSCLVEWR
jgi:hypothetical protein